MKAILWLAAQRSRVGVKYRSEVFEAKSSVVKVCPFFAVAHDRAHKDVIPVAPRSKRSIRSEVFCGEVFCGEVFCGEVFCGEVFWGESLPFSRSRT